MALPVPPQDYCPLVPNPSTPLCDSLKQVLLQKSQADCQNLSFLFNDDGTAISEEFATMICTALGLIDCGSGGTTSTTTAGTGTTSSSTTTAATAVVYAVTATNKFISIDLATGAVTVIKTGTSYFWCLAQDPTDGTIYGFVNNAGAFDFVTIDAVTGAETVLGAGITFAGTTTPNGLSFNSGGTLYCESADRPTSAATTGTLSTINKANGTRTGIGTHASVWLADICFVGSTLYGIGQFGSFTNKRTFTLDLSTAAATQISICSPVETEPRPVNFDDALAYINGLLFKTYINQIAIVNTGSGLITQVATYDNAINGNITNMAYNG